MRLDEVRHESRRILDDYFRLRHLNPEARLQAMAVTERTDEHFSIGLSRIDEGQFRLEVRVREENGLASEYANNLRGRYGEHISVSRVMDVEVPSFARAQKAEVRRGTEYFTAVRRPLSLGASIAHLDGDAGSVGLFVKFEAPELMGRWGVLSNSHVLALAGKAQKGDSIYQPGRPDATNVMAGNEVGYLHNYTLIRASGTQDLDAAVAILKEDPKDKLRGFNRIPNELTGCDHCGSDIKTVTNPENLPANAELCKVGRTTGWTKGVLTAIGVDNLPVYYPQLGANARFDNVFEITWKSEAEPFSWPGDSGSLVYDPATKAAVGLIFAGGVRELQGKQVGVSYACNIAGALASLGLRMPEIPGT